MSLALPTRAGTNASGPAEPRIVNIYNFVRNTDYRIPDADRAMFQVVAEQIKLVHANHFNGTWALQYDALINPQYQKLLKEQLSTQDEIGAWWEFPRSLVEKAGLKWNGKFDWDPSWTVDYSSGYSPDERRRFVDLYMADFKAIFGYYPRTVGSWYIDEITLAYMVEKYGIVASCNTQDRLRNGPFDPKSYVTLWGGYRSQAYYPSKLDAYMPAQNRAGQIDVPVFRMLGSDPLYQYSRSPHVYAMEPVYAYSGGSTQWVDWYIRNLIDQPSLSFAYTQFGQENSFTWDTMKQGLAYQLSALAERAKSHEIRVETLRQSGEWFKSQFEVTPPTSVVCLDDWRHQGQKSVWYDSRFYRLNLLWKKTGIMIRDLHRFDENKVSSAHEAASRGNWLTYLTLPIIDAGMWTSDPAGGSAVPVIVDPDGQSTPLVLTGDPVVTQKGGTELQIVQPLDRGGTLTILCSEASVTFLVVDAHSHPIGWALQLHGGDDQKKAVERITADKINFNVDRFRYDLKLSSGTIRQSPEGTILLLAGPSGQLTLQLDQ